MAEQSEILKLSLREYKKQIDALKESLLSLDRESDEYKKTLKKVQEMQEKQKQVNDDIKKTNLGAADSYKSLNAQLNEMRKRWKEMAAGDERDKLGKEILDLNNRLVELDETTGVHNRKVGSYKIAIKEAYLELMNLTEGSDEYNKKAAEVSELLRRQSDMQLQARGTAQDFGQVVGNIATSFGGLIGGMQVVQGALNAMGVDGKDAAESIKKLQGLMAITSGISAMDNAGKAVNRLWIQIKNAVAAQTAMRNATAATATAEGQQAAAATATTSAMAGQTAATNAATVATNAFKSALTSTGIGALVVGLGMAVSKLLDFAGGMIKSKDATDELASSTERLNKFFESQDEVRNRLQSATSDRINLLKSQGATEQEIHDATIKGYQDELVNLNQNAEALQQEDKNYQNYLGKKRAGIKTTKAEDDKYTDEYIANLNKRKRANEQEIESINISIQVENNTFKKSEEDKTKKVKEEAAKRAAEAKKESDEKIKAEAKALNDSLNAYEKWSQESLTRTLNDYDKKFKALGDAEGAEYKQIVEHYALLQKTYKEDSEEYIRLEEQKQKDLLAITEYYAKEKQKVIREQDDLLLKKQLDDIEKVFNRSQSSNNNDLQNTATESARQLLSGDITLNQYDDANANAEINYLLTTIELLKQKREALIELGQDTSDIDNEIAKNQETLYLKQKSLNDKEKANLQSKLDKTAQIANATADVMNAVADAYSDTIKRELEQGKISEEEAEAQFKRVKGMQIAAAVIQGLTGIATALSGAFTTKSGPWDIALAAAQATSIAASTAIQVAKIKQTNIGGDGGGEAALSVPATNYASVEPILNESQDLASMSQQMQMQGDMRVYILESDIQSSNNRVQVRQNNTTF